MRLKALGVFLLVGFAAFTTFYWITDAPRRDASAVIDEEELLEFGRLVFLFDDTYTIAVTVTEAGFDQTEVSVFVNTSISFDNQTASELTFSGTGAQPFEIIVPADGTSPVKFDEEGETTVSAGGVDGSLTVTAGPPHLAPYGAGCARCHGIDGTGGAIPGDPSGRQAPNLHSRSLASKWQDTGGVQSLNNYVAWVITLGGVVVGGDINSPMPAWGQEYGGSLTRQQIEALTALIGSWAEETLAQPAEEVPDTVEAGRQVYTDAGCGSCHGPNLEGGVGPNLQTIGSRLITDLPVVPAHLDQMQADYDADKRVFLEKWIGNGAINYNDGAAIGGMPAYQEILSESELRALITFLLDQTQ